MSAADELTQILGPDAVSTEANDVDAHAGDSSPSTLIARRRGAALPRASCVVRPRSTDEVVAVLGWADRTRTPVVAFGGGSGVCGAVAPEGAVVVDMGGMSRVLDLDAVSRVVTVQAGITGPELSSFLEPHGSMIGHQPQSQSISTVGGWIATRACGQLSARYGGIDEVVVALEAVLAGGRVARSKVAPRRATGPDVASLMIGSEGTLGIVTEATLRIDPIPETRVDLCASFEHMSDAVAGCRALSQSELGPTLVRLYDREDAAILFRDLHGAPAGPLLLASLEGRDATGRADAAAALVGGTREGSELVAHWWSHRNDAVDEYSRMMAGKGILGPHAVVDTMEVAGTWGVMRDLYHGMKETLSPLADHVGCHLSHVYPDGACLYFTLAAACTDDDHAQRTDDAWWAAGMTTCLQSGGTISHHHGIGRLKAQWLPEELDGWWDVLRAVKAALDPNRIMNPGALGL